ncbi:MAG TPA: Ig domain-containing protein, partial [Acidobacteriaceae bacterium]|nr:Ig domain-containing protein [Acidobacteriaceae bacterium]
TALPSGQVSTSYAAALNASGGTPGYTWSLASGQLPAGLALSSAGVVSGTPTASGTSTFTVGVKDSGSPAQTQSATESITVSAAPSKLTITSTSLSAGNSGNSYSATLSASGGTPGYTWSLPAGSLPPGLRFSSAGVISGAPTASGTWTFTVAAKDSGSPVQTASVQESIAVSAAPAALTVTSTSLSAAQTGSSYSATLSATGGTPGYTWSIASGSLPVGLTMSSAGVISGTPTAAGDSSFKVTVTDSASPAQTASAQESISVGAAQLTITTVALGYGTSGSGYSATLDANGGTPAYTWSIASGSLPAGLTMSSAGVISGTPTAAGTSNFSVSVADSASPQVTASQPESITVNAYTNSSSGAQIYVYPQTPVAPSGSYQTVTAVVTGVNNKTVTWSSDGGTIVGTNPCVVNEPCTVALYTTTPGTYHLTAKSNASSSVTASSTITITASPTPQTAHPRLGGITAAMLPALRAKAVMSNPLYATLYNTAVNDYNSIKGSWSWSCNAGSGQPNADLSESWEEGDAYLFAFMSMVDPNDSTYNWGCYGRDIWMYYANFWLNPMSSAYSADSAAIRQVDANYGLTGNHGADSTEALTLTPDWLMAGGYLSAADQQVTRAYFALAAKQMINIALTGNRATVGNYNSPAQVNTNSIWDFDGQRAMGNNYSHSKVLYLTAAALIFNDTPTDDPALTNSCGAGRYTVCADGTAGSLHAYWTYLTGGVLYKDWAHMEDPAVSQDAYQAAFSNLSGTPKCEDSASGTQVPCFGDGRGGESSEGSWYQYSMYRLALAMASIQSAGYNDPVKYGPQMSLATSSWWDLKAVSDLEFLTYEYAKSQPRMAYFSTGDSLQLFRAPSDFNAEAWMMVSDSMNGRTDRTASLEWPLLYTSIGGISSFYGNLANGYGAPNAIPLFLSLPAADPTANAPADPRVQMPTDLYNGGNQHILARSGWDPNGTFSASEGDGGTNTAFSYYCANSRNDHEHETCGGFDVLSQGEFITKTRTVFNDYNMMLATAEFSNGAGYGVAAQAPCATAGSCFEWQAALGSDGKGGGQFWHGYQAGSATLEHAELPGYVAAIVDTTNLYNGSAAVGWGGMSGITAASRSLIYLRGSNQVVYYDRGAGGSSSKRVWMTTTGPITVNGSVANWSTRSGKQTAYVSSLLPANATLSDAGAYMTNENGNPGTSDWEPYSHLLIDAGSPASTQFLTVLEWGGSSFTKSHTVLVQSTAGQNFDGALVGSTLVMFMRNWPAAFTGVTYPASGATAQYVSDLTPNTTYSISGAGAPATATTDTAGVLTFSAAGTGSITVAPSH